MALHLAGKRQNLPAATLPVVRPSVWNHKHFMLK